MSESIGRSLPKNHATSHDLAQRLVSYELSCADDVLSRFEWRTVGAIYAANKARLARETSFGPLAAWDVDTAIEYLVLRGLVAAEHDEWETTDQKPQRYRWSRVATIVALTRFADASVRCPGRGCSTIVTNGKRWCSTRCRISLTHAVNEI